jgi:hypothetical protein
MVRGPAHGPLARVDVVQLAACARARALVTLAILKKLLLAGMRGSLPKMDVMGTT